MMKKLGYWIDNFLRINTRSDQKVTACKNDEMRSFYVVVEEITNEEGHTIEYMYQYKFRTYREAAQKMKEEGKCNQIDYWDGDEWWFDVHENIEAHI